jgi:hypothetical protein
VKVGHVTDRELWTCARNILEQYGKPAPRFVAARIGALAMADDETGIATWKAIARRMNRLVRADPSTQ